MKSASAQKGVALSSLRIDLLYSIFLFISSMIIHVRFEGSQK